MRNHRLTSCLCALLLGGAFLPAQTFEWAKSSGGSSEDYGISITVDASGNVYTTGSFYGTVDFDPGAGTVNLTSVGNNDISVQKLDASGNFLWAKSFAVQSLGTNSGFYRYPRYH